MTCKETTFRTLGNITIHYSGKLRSKQVVRMFLRLTILLAFTAISGMSLRLTNRNVAFRHEPVQLMIPNRHICHATWP